MVAILWKVGGMMKEIEDIINKLIKSFPYSFVNNSGEFIAEAKTNSYFILEDCKCEQDVQCKVLEWLSRSAFKSIFYNIEWRNEEIRKFMRDGINEFLDTEFSIEDFEIIYTRLGNACHHELTKKFIKSGYNMGVLRKESE